MPGSASGKTPFDYKFVTATLASERDGYSQDIQDAIVELDLYEHLEQPYMTATMVMIDNTGIFEKANFKGTETLALEIEFPGKLESGVADQLGTIKKKFNLTRIISSHKTNDNAEVITFYMVEDIFFKSRSQVISKAYEGKPNEIIAKILEDNDLGYDLITDGIEVQPAFRYLVPYITPMNAMIRVKETATTQEGLPFFLFSALGFENSLSFESLEDFLTTTPLLPANQPFTFSIYGTGKMDENVPTRGRKLGLDDQGLVIESYRIDNTEDTLKLTETGAISREYEYYNLNELDYGQNKMDITEVFSKLRNILPRDQKVPSYDDASGLHEGVGRKSVVPYLSDIYSDGQPNAHDLGETAGSNIEKRFVRNAVRQFFKNEAVHIEVPGYHFFPTEYTRAFSFENSRTLGRRIPIRFLTTDVEKELGGEIEELVDKKRSGEYLIFAARHSFGVEKYTASLTCFKLSRQEE